MGWAPRFQSGCTSRWSEIGRVPSITTRNERITRTSLQQIVYPTVTIQTLTVSSQNHEKAAP
jgi:hypothetical protein